MSWIRAVVACSVTIALAGFCACAKNGDSPFAKLPDAQVIDASPIKPDVNPFQPDANVDGGIDATDASSEPFDAIVVADAQHVGDAGN